MVAKVPQRDVGAWRGRATALLHALSTNATVTDSYQVVPVAQNLVHPGTIGLGHAPALGDPLPLNSEQHHGVLYSVFPWTVSLFVLPVVAGVEAAHGLGIGDHVPPSGGSR